MVEESDKHQRLRIETEELWRVYKVGTREVPALRGVSLAYRTRALRRRQGTFGQRQDDAAKLHRRPRPAHVGCRARVWDVSWRR